MTADTLSLKGKTALVTGSGRENGIGAAIARAFARNGAAVAIHYATEGSRTRAEKVAADITREFGTKTTVIQGAVDKAGNATKIIQETLEGLGASHIDILVNNAGIALAKTLSEATPEIIKAEFGVHVFGPIYLTQAVIGIGKMPRGGRIINVGSVASKIGIEIGAVYGAAKAAQDSLTTSWAGHIGHSHGITVNTLAPGPTMTDMGRPFLEATDGTASAAMTKAMEAQTRAEGRLGTVDDVADAALLLVSEKSRWLTAQWIDVSGGIVGTM